jgi:hypothetical protein
VRQDALEEDRFDRDLEAEIVGAVGQSGGAVDPRGITASGDEELCADVGPLANIR